MTASLRLEDFIQAVQSQLDNAQAAMALKARNLNLPLTFAIKDINLDLRAHVEFVESEVRIRPAGPGETETSVFHLVFTTITRPSIEENAIALSDDSKDQPLDALSSDLTTEDRKRLEWAGVRTVRQFQQAEQRDMVHTIGRVTNLPVDRLRRALDRASAPQVDRIEPVAPPVGTGPDAPPLLRVLGRNLVNGSQIPLVRIGNRPVSVLQSAGHELLLAPAADQWAGELAVSPSSARATAIAFDLSAFAPPSAAAQPPQALAPEAAAPSSAAARPPVMALAPIPGSRETLQ
jgi:hypothetical protein